MGGVQKAPATVLVLPGFGGSGPGHWQSLWEHGRGWTRVVQDDWERPDCDRWVARLDEAIRRSPGPVALVAHSLGCILVAHWAVRHGPGSVCAAFLVAPPDVDEVQYVVPEIASFAPVPRTALGFPGLLVASRDDPYGEPVRIAELASAWGVGFVDLGACGHVNVEAGFGPWPDGLALFDTLVACD